MRRTTPVRNIWSLLHAEKVDIFASVCFRYRSAERKSEIPLEYIWLSMSARTIMCTHLCGCSCGVPEFFSCEGGGGEALPYLLFYVRACVRGYVHTHNKNIFGKRGFGPRQPQPPPLMATTMASALAHLQAREHSCGRARAHTNYHNYRGLGTVPFYRHICVQHRQAKRNQPRESDLGHA